MFIYVMWTSMSSLQNTLSAHTSVLIPSHVSGGIHYILPARLQTGPRLASSVCALQASLTKRYLCKKRRNHVASCGTAVCLMEVHCEDFCRLINHATCSHSFPRVGCQTKVPSRGLPTTVALDDMVVEDIDLANPIHHAHEDHTQDEDPPTVY